MKILLCILEYTIQRLNSAQKNCFQKHRLMIFLSLILYTSPVLSATHFTLRGTSADSNLDLQTQSTVSGSASVATDVGAHLRLGLTHRRDISAQQGYVRGVEAYTYSQTTTHLSANSIDITIILYYGEILVPYIMIGIIKKDYLIETADSGVSQFSPPISPNGGFGVGLKINRSFSLKLSVTISEGSSRNSPTDIPRRALDRVSTVGITYNL